MNLKAHYDDLYDTSVELIKKDQYTIDHLIDDPSDNRFGITLLIRPPDHIKEHIQRFISKIKTLEPNQYYYESSDIHITVMSIISCFNGFKLDHIHIQDYIDVIHKCLLRINNFSINFRGITASPTGLMVQGFTSDASLNILRDHLRNAFKNTGLLQSIDKRYTIKTAHATVVRFREHLNDKHEFLKAVKAHRTHNFGTFDVNALELVYNDWYQREALVKKLFEFHL
ncbi:mutarotase [Seonamhaeicola sp.]|uniref:2'-5' RNA ligase family protein n=1 Tax=Seonamhaeicola sp. TaxID=1912245 RepID=UPI00261BF40C|nr:mutarotase [Seonamhaeicola sp.]